MAVAIERPQHTRYEMIHLALVFIACVMSLEYETTVIRGVDGLCPKLREGTWRSTSEVWVYSGDKASKKKREVAHTMATPDVDFMTVVFPKLGSKGFCAYSIHSMMGSVVIDERVAQISSRKIRVTITTFSGDTVVSSYSVLEWIK
jgi:hypothetical protein